MQYLIQDIEDNEVTIIEFPSDKWAGEWYDSISEWDGTLRGVQNGDTIYNTIHAYLKRVPLARVVIKHPNLTVEYLTKQCPELFI